MTIFAKLTVSWFARVREKRSGLPRARNLSGFLSKAGAFLSGFIFFRRPCLSRQAGQEVIAHRVLPPCQACSPLVPPAKFASSLPVLHLFPNALPLLPVICLRPFLPSLSSALPLCPRQARFPFACFAPARRVRRRFVLPGFSFAAIWPLLGKNARS